MLIPCVRNSHLEIKTNEIFLCANMKINFSVNKQLLQKSSHKSKFSVNCVRYNKLCYINLDKKFLIYCPLIIQNNNAINLKIVKFNWYLIWLVHVWHHMFHESWHTIYCRTSIVGAVYCKQSAIDKFT